MNTKNKNLAFHTQQKYLVFYGVERKMKLNLEKTENQNFILHGTRNVKQLETYILVSMFLVKKCFFIIARITFSVNNYQTKTSEYRFQKKINNLPKNYEIFRPL